MLTPRQLDPFGCEVDLNLGRRTSEDEAELIALFNRHHLIVFRNQQLSHPEQAQFMSLFGSVLPGAEGSGVITNDIAPENVLGDKALAFHSDLSFLPRPYETMSLHAIEVEDGKSSTMFVDATRAAARLDDELRARASKAETVQVISYDLGGRNDVTEHSAPASHIHPVLRKHPRTGEDILMVSYNQTARIANMDADAGNRLIEDLFEQLYAPEEIYEHVWHPGDLVLFDNLALQHARGPVDAVGIRRLQRVVVSEVGLFDQLPDGYEIRTEVSATADFSERD